MERYSELHLGKLEKNTEYHFDLINSNIYGLVALSRAEFTEKYFLLHIKRKPKYMPQFIYKWFIKNLVVKSEFRKL